MVQLEESGQWLEHVGRTHLVLASGKPALQKNESQRIPDTLTWWINGYVQLILSLVGFMANLVSISILCRTEMCNAFNRLLAGLAVSDNLHLICTVVIASITIRSGKAVNAGPTEPLEQLTDLLKKTIS